MPVPALDPFEALRRHWPEYAIEGWALGMFMVSASVATVLLYDPRSLAFHLIQNDFWKRALMAVAMAGTAVAIIYSRWGKRSGAHMKPAFTLSFWFMGKINTVDAIYYALFHFVGGVAGSLLSYVLTGGLLADPQANRAVTVPGPQGILRRAVQRAYHRLHPDVRRGGDAQFALRPIDWHSRRACAVLVALFRVRHEPARSFASALPSAPGRRSASISWRRRGYAHSRLLHSTCSAFRRIRQPKLNPNP